MDKTLTLEEAFEFTLLMFRDLQTKHTLLLESNEALVKALKFYVGGKAEDKVIEWNPHVCNSYTGLQYAPDWLGEMQNEPGEIAANALAAHKELMEKLK